MTQALSLEIAEKISEVFPMIMRQLLKRQASELAKGNITMPQILILNFLDRQDESRMTDLAHFMNVTTAAMTGLVERLFKYGYVIRMSDPNDRRIIKIKLTSRGSTLAKKINQQRRQVVIDIFGKLSQRERENYLKVITRIRDILAQSA